MTMEGYEEVLAPCIAREIPSFLIFTLEHKN